MAAHPLSFVLREGDVLSTRYQLVELLACGGMATVWRARDQLLARQVAVKILSQQLISDDSSHVRMHTEAQALAQLSHPNIAAVHDVGTAAAEGRTPVPYLVMELADGITLSTVDTQLPWQAAVTIGMQVADALAAAHDAGVVHRDITAANVVLTPAGVKVVDFGICALAGDPDNIGGNILGTPAYMAPERLDGRTVSPAVDIYAAGVLLYHALAGRWPWPGGSTDEILAAHRTRNPGPLEVPGMPAAVAQICLQCLAKDPAQRPTARQLAAKLQEHADPRALADTTRRLMAAGGTPGQAVSFTGQAVQSSRRRASSGFARHRRKAVLAGAMTAIVGVSAWTLTGWTPSADAIQPQALGPAAPASTAAACIVAYHQASQGEGHLTATVSVTNTSGTGVPAGWQLQFAMPGQQHLDHPQWTLAGTVLTSAAAEAALASGGTVSWRLTGRQQPDQPVPQQFRFNDRLCTTTVVSVENTSPAVAIAQVAAPANAGGTATQTGDTKLGGKPAGPPPGKRPKRNAGT